LWAAASGWEEGVELLLQSRKVLKLEVQKLTESAFGPLHAAAGVGCDKICKALIAAEHQVNISSKWRVYSNFISNFSLCKLCLKCD